MRIAALPIAVVSMIGLLVLSAGAADRLITVDQASYSATRDAVEAIEVYGGRVKIVVHPHFIFADLPDRAEARILSTRSVSDVHAAELEPERFAHYGPDARHIITAWNNVFMGRSAQMGLDDPPSPERLPLVNDALESDDPLMLQKPPGAKVQDTSEFMLGNITVGFILPESNGAIDPNSEDWTGLQQDNVTSEIISGLNWYVTKAGWRDLTFYTVFHYSIPTGYEPITHSTADEALWREQCLDYLGYDNARQFCRVVRDSFDADWGVLGLVVDDWNDADNQFSGGGFAYSYLGGPNFVMTYDNDGWGIGNMDAVMAHELGHSFYALDEYYQGYEPCTAMSGYLSVENQNSQYPGGCDINVPSCIMRSVSLSSASVCNYTKGQLGWRESDGDSIPDILDTYPETVLYEYSPDPCSTFTPTYAGSSWVTKLTNLNPRNFNRHDITLNRIARVEYRVDGGPWQDALPNDGVWADDAGEGFHFTTDPLTDSTHVIEARAHHTYGNIDTTFAADTLTVSGSSGVVVETTQRSLHVDASPNPFGPMVEIRYSIPGEYGTPVDVSMRIYDVRGREITRLMDAMRGPGPGRIAWNGTYSNGNPAPSGVYFIDLAAGESRVVKKLVMTR